MDETRPMLPPPAGTAAVPLPAPSSGAMVPTLPGEAPTAPLSPTPLAPAPTPSAAPVALPDSPPGSSPWAPGAPQDITDTTAMVFEPVETGTAPRRRLMLAMTAVIALAVGVGAFFAMSAGSGTDDASVRYVTDDDADATDAFSFSTATTTVEVSAAMRMTMDMVAPGMSAEMTAEIDRASQRASLSLTTSSDDAMFAFDFSGFEVISDEATDTVYVNGESYATFIDVDTDWISMTTEDTGGGLDLDEFFDQPVDMASIFAGLDPVDLGVETIDGEQLKHFAVTMTIDELLAEDPQALEGFGTADLTLLESITYDVWVTEQSLLRRVVLDTDVAGERINFDMGLEHVDHSIDIALPDPADVTDWSLLLDDAYTFDN